MAAAAMTAAAVIAEATTLRTRPRPACLLCGSPGTVLHAAVRDLYFGVPGEWTLRRCANPACGLVWQDPMVVGEDLVRAYQGYYTTADGSAGAATSPTHGFGNAFFRLDRALERLLGLGAERLRHAAAYLEGVAPGALLDVGCGDGAFAAAMRARGWDARGTDFDPAAAAAARRRHGLQVEVGDLRDIAFPAASFDAVTARHVVEHVADPIAFVAECWRLLRPGGRLVLVTPNIDSLGHRHFGTRWRGLEQPRHLFLFGVASMRSLSRRAGVASADVSASAQGAPFVLRASLQTSRGLLRRGCDSLVVATLAWREAALARRGRPVGEELVLVAVKEAGR